MGSFSTIGGGIAEINIISVNHNKTNYNLGAGAETTLIAIDKKGYASVIYIGDGDGTFKIRTYIDNTLEDEFYTNETRIGNYAFNISCVIKLYNPSSSQTKSSMTLYIRGVSK